MLLSTAYLPSISYMAMCSVSSKASIESCENYVKQSFRNRTQIASSNGILDLIIPIEKSNGSKTHIKDIKIMYAEQWNKQHIHAINSAYKSSPFFEFYADDFMPIIEKQFTFLWDLNLELLKAFSKIIPLQCEFVETNQFLEIQSQNAEDYRYVITPKKQLPKEIFDDYYQVFNYKYGFIPNLSIIDLISNVGPDSIIYLKNVGCNLQNKSLSDTR